MYEISAESIQKIVEVQKLINNVEIKGASNIFAMYNAIGLLQKIIDELQDTLSKEQNIVIDNTKEVSNGI